MPPGAARRLIVTADDLGASSEVNEAVVRAARSGILRFASLMVAEPAAEEAVRRVKAECPQLRLGLHAALCQGRSILGPGVLGDLVDGDGLFPEDPVRCGMRYFFDRACRPLLERELRAQFERFLGWGLPPGHADGHLNIHVHPVLYPMLSRLCREHGFRRLRLPGGELGASLGYSLRPLAKQFKEGVVFGLLRRWLRQSPEEGFPETPEQVWGLLRSGVMTRDYAVHLIRRLPPGTTEMYFHPSSEPGSRVVDRPTPSHRTLTELETLLDPALREAVGSGGIELV